MMRDVLGDQRRDLLAPQRKPAAQVPVAKSEISQTISNDVFFKKQTN